MHKNIISSLCVKHNKYLKIFLNHVECLYIGFYKYIIIVFVFRKNCFIYKNYYLDINTYILFNINIKTQVSLFFYVYNQFICKHLQNMHFHY